MKNAVAKRTPYIDVNDRNGRVYRTHALHHTHHKLQSLLTRNIRTVQQKKKRNRECNDISDSGERKNKEFVCNGTKQTSEDKKHAQAHRTTHSR